MQFCSIYALLLFQFLPFQISAFVRKRLSNFLHFSFSVFLAFWFFLPFWIYNFMLICFSVFVKFLPFQFSALYFLLCSTFLLQAFFCAILQCIFHAFLLFSVSAVPIFCFCYVSSFLILFFYFFYFHAFLCFVCFCRFDLFCFYSFLFSWLFFLLTFSASKRFAYLFVSTCKLFCLI